MQTKKYFYYIVQRGGKLFSSPLEEEHLFSRPITEDLLKHFSSFIRSKSFILSTNQKKCLYSLNQSKTSFYSLSSNRKKTAILPSTPRKSSAVSPVIVVSANQIKFQIPSLLLFFFFFSISITCRSWRLLPSGEQHNKISCTRPSILQLYDEYSYKNKGILK